MRNLLFLLIPIFLISCGKDDTTSYPKLYTYDSFTQDEDGLFLVVDASNATSIPVNTGSYGRFGPELKAEVLESMTTIFDIHEIELLSDSKLRLHMTVDNEEVIDTTFSYTKDDEKIIIDAFGSSQLFSYNADADQFEMCSRTEFALPGPNVIDPGLEYNIWQVSECLADHDLDDYAQLMLDAIEYQPQDTLGILITKLIYK